MSFEKPSDKEEEFFAREHYEKLKALAEKQAKEEKETSREERKSLHYMHCPKCGGDLAEIVFKEVHIDKCTLCEGIWLDAGELEEIINKEDGTVMKRILQVFR